MNFDNPVIIIRPEYENNMEYLLFNLGKIKLQRDLQRSYFKEDLLQEKTELFMQELDILVSRNGVKEDLLKPFSLNSLITIKKNLINIKILTSHLILNIKKSHISFIQALIEQNLLKKPLKDRSFNEISQDFTKENRNLSKEVLDLKVQLDFESINVFLIEEINEIQLLIPVCLFMFRALRASYSQNLKGKSFEFIGNSLIGSYFILRNEGDDGFLEEYSLIGQISRKKTHNIQKKAEAFDIMSVKQELKSETLKPQEFEIAINQEKKANFRLGYFEDEKNKELTVLFLGLQINIMLEILIKIYKICDFEQISEKGMEKSFSFDNSNDFLMKNTDKYIEKEVFSKKNIEKGFKLKADFLDCCLSLSCSDNYVLKMLGEITILSIKGPISLKSLQELTINLKQFELFICEMVELYKNPLEIKRKRSIFLPFDLNSSITSELLESTNSHNIMISIDHFMAEISYKDVLILKETFENQLELLRLLEEKTQKNPQFSSANQSDNFLVDFKSESLHILLINDVQSFFAPFLYFKLNNCDVLLIKTIEKSSLEINFGFKTSYYNFFASCWEPIIENIELKLLFNQENKLKNLIISQIDSKSLLNINISTQMIDLFLKNYDLITKDLGKKQVLKEKVMEKQKSKKMLIAEHFLYQKKKDRLSIQISPSISFDQGNFFHNFEENTKGNLISRHAILNLTGITLEIEVLNVYNQQKILLNHGQTSNVFLENNMDYDELMFNNEKSFETNRNNVLNIFLKDVKIKVMIWLEKSEKNNGKFNAIQELSLDRVLARKHMIYQLINPNTINEIAILSKVNLHNRTNTKLLILTSPVILRNLSRKNLEIKILSKKMDDLNKNLTIKLNHSEEFIVPIDQIQSIFVFRVKNDIYWSSQLSIESLMKSGSSDLINIRVGLETLITINRENSLEFPNWQKILTFYPNFSLRNYLPFPLEIDFFFKNVNNFANFIIYPEESLPLYINKQEIYIRIRGKDFIWTEEFLLFQEKDERRIKLKEKSGLSINIVFSEASSRIDYAFYPEVLIYNNSPFNLELSGKNSIGDIIESQTIKTEEILASFAQMIEINSNNKNVVLKEFSIESVEVLLENEEKVDVIIETKAMKFGRFLLIKKS